MALSPDEQGNPRFLKMRVTPNIKQASVKKFVHATFANGNIIHRDGHRSYSPTLEGYTHEHNSYDSGLLHWLHVVISNTKVFVLGTYYGLSKKNLQSYLDEYSFRFSHSNFAGALVEPSGSVCSALPLN